MASRRGRRLVIIDIAVLRDVEAATESLPDVTLYDIDDLEQVAEANLGGRRREPSEPGASFAKSSPTSACGTVQPQPRRPSERLGVGGVDPSERARRDRTAVELTDAGSSSASRRRDTVARGETVPRTNAAAAGARRPRLRAALPREPPLPVSDSPTDTARHAAPFRERVDRDVVERDRDHSRPAHTAGGGSLADHSNRGYRRPRRQWVQACILPRSDGTTLLQNGRCSVWARPP
jgi:hypothetical protein